MPSNKRCLSLPPEAKRASRKATKQAVPHESQPAAEEADTALLQQLMQEIPGTELGLDEEEPPSNNCGAVADGTAAARPDGTTAPAQNGTGNENQQHEEGLSVVHGAVAGDPTRDARSGATAAASTAGNAAATHAEDVSPLLAPPGPAPTASEQTLLPKTALATSPLIVQGNPPQGRAKRASSSHAKQMLEQLADWSSDDGGGGSSGADDGSPPPSLARSSKRRKADSDFEVSESGSSSSSESDSDLDDEDDSDGDVSASDGEGDGATPPKKAKRGGRGAVKAPAKAQGARPSAGSTAAPGCRAARGGRGAGKSSSGRMSQGAAAPCDPVGSGGGRGCGRGRGRGRGSGRAASGRGEAAPAAGGTGAAAEQLQAAAGGAIPLAAAAGAALGGAASRGSSCVARSAPTSTAQRVPLAAVATPAALQPEQCLLTSAAAARGGTLGSGSGSGIGGACTGVELVGSAATVGVLPAAAAKTDRACSSLATTASASRAPTLRLGRKQLGLGGFSSPAFADSSRGAGGTLRTGIPALAGSGAADSTAASAVAANSIAPVRHVPSAAGGMFGGAAFRVPGLRRPKK